MFSFRKWIATIQKKPYVEVISDSVSELDGFEIKLDWNAAFITELSKAGIDGDDDEEMVQIWLNRIMRSQDIDDYDAKLLEIAQLQAKNQPNDMENY